LLKGETRISGKRCIENGRSGQTASTVAFRGRPFHQPRSKVMFFPAAPLESEIGKNQIFAAGR
jgi:hypothetical protein